MQTGRLWSVPWRWRAAAGWTSPNPLVGAVVVRDGRVIGEGRHERFGQAHAERRALAACTESPRGATLYVTLEPCCHTGKQPPCTDAIIEAGIARVVVGSRDPNPLVAGKGVARLRAAGIEVRQDVLRDACDALNPAFFRFITTGLPYVVAKWAMTLDGKIAAATGDARWVSGEAARADVHELRHRMMAVMTGVGTVLADDPLLTCRRTVPSRQPLRVVCDSRLRIPEDCALMRTVGEAPLLIATAAPQDGETRSASAERAAKAERLRAAGAEVVELADDGHGHVSLPALIRALGARGIDSVLLEGGAQITAAALRARIVQEIVAYIAPKIVGGRDAPTPVGGEGAALMRDALALGRPRVEMLGCDVKLSCSVPADADPAANASGADARSGIPTAQTDVPAPAAPSSAPVPIGEGDSPCAAPARPASGTEVR